MGCAHASAAARAASLTARAAAAGCGGSPTGIDRAIFAYNHAGWYVTEVLSWAARYASPGSRAAAAPMPAGLASQP